MESNKISCSLFQKKQRVPELGTFALLGPSVNVGVDRESFKGNSSSHSHGHKNNNNHNLKKSLLKRKQPCKYFLQSG